MVVLKAYLSHMKMYKKATLCAAPLKEIVDGGRLGLLRLYLLGRAGALFEEFKYSW